MSSSVFGLAKTSDQAGRIVGQLKLVGFVDNDISVLMPDKSGSRDFAHEHHTKAPEGAAAGAGAGGIVGGTIGLLAGIGALAIPGLGPFVAAGPIMAALSGIAVGATVGGVAGALVGLGMPEFEAKRYEGKVIAGNVLISVHTETSEEAKLAKSVLQQEGAEDISVGSEATPAGPSSARSGTPGPNR